MTDFNEKFENFELDDQALEQVAGGASTSGAKRKLVVCPLCQVEGTYEKIMEVFPDISAHYKHLCELGLIENGQISVTDYAIRLWNAATPVASTLEEE